MRQAASRARNGEAAREIRAMRGRAAANFIAGAKLAGSFWGVPVTYVKILPAGADLFA
jgi:hypothetical protein